MRCPNYVIFRITPKGKRVVFATHADLNLILCAMQAKHVPKGSRLLDIQKCDGRIKAQIINESAPYFGGCDHYPAIEYTCETCGCHYYPSLSSDIDVVSEWLTNYIETLHQEDNP